MHEADRFLQLELVKQFFRVRYKPRSRRGHIGLAIALLGLVRLPNDSNPRSVTQLFVGLVHGDSELACNVLCVYGSFLSGRDVIDEPSGIVSSPSVQVQTFDEGWVKNQSRDREIRKVHLQPAIFGAFSTWKKGSNQADGAACLDKCRVVATDTQVFNV